MKHRIISLVLVSLLVLSMVSCGRSNDGNQPNDEISPISSIPAIDPDISDEPIQTHEPEAPLRYSFEEIVAVQPKYFVDGGAIFQVKSSEANYYGEITVGQRSYIDGASGNLEGTYALFVTENGGTAFINIEFTDKGFSYKNQSLGEKAGNAVKYPFDNNDRFNFLLECKYNKNQSLPINKLSYLHIDWRSTKSVFSEVEFNMLAVVISKEEAIRYVQDGKLPAVLDGLTVTGLDKIFVNPENKPQEPVASSNVTEIVSPKYGDIGIFSEGLAAVTIGIGNDARWGYIDESGNEVIPLQYLRAKPYSDGLAVVQNLEGRFGFIDKTGKEVIPFGTYYYAYSFSDGLATVAITADSCCVIDTSGNVVIPSGMYSFIESFSEDLAMVRTYDKKTGVIDKAGNVVIAPDTKYTRIEKFSEGLAAVKVNNKWGYIDTEGNEVIPPKYDNALPFSEGLAAVGYGKLGDSSSKWGFIDKSGNEVIPIIYSGDNYYGESFNDGTAAVVSSVVGGDAKKIVIDKNGNPVAELAQYSFIGPFRDGFAICREGVVDKQGILVAANVEATYYFSRDKNHAGNILPIYNGNYKYGFVRIENN